MKVNPFNPVRPLPPLPVEEEAESREEEGKKKVDEAKRAVETERLDVMDRHHETVRKSAELYDEKVKKRVLEKQAEESRLRQREFLAERNEEAERLREEERKSAGKI